jgi:hypothetical protein
MDQQTSITEFSPQQPTFSLAPRDIKEALAFAEMLSKSNMVPKDFMGNPGNILVAVQWGMELGLQPMQAMQNIAVINGRPSLWGDSVIALVKASPACEYVIEEVGDDSATCRVKRRGEPEQERSFSTSDAKAAGLLGKQGPWSQYKKRMLQMRARSWALRDVFPDVLRGMPIAEEVMDMEKEINPIPAKRQTGKQAAEAAKQQADAEVDADARAELVAKLQKIAEEEGEVAYADAFADLGKEGRLTVGADEHKRLKAIAAETTRAMRELDAKLVAEDAQEGGDDE